MKRSVTNGILITFIFVPILAISIVLLDTGLVSRFLFIALITSVSFVSLIFWNVESAYKLMPFKSMITFCLFLWLAATVVSGINDSDRAEYFFETSKVLTYVSGFLIMGWLTSVEYSWKLILKTTVLVANVLGFIGLGQMAYYHVSFDVSGLAPVTGLMSNKNLYAEYLGILTPILACSVFNLKRYWKLASLIALIMSVVIILVLMTRSVWIALIISTIIGLTLLLKKLVSTERESAQNRFVKWISRLWIALVMVVFLFEFITDGAILSRLFSIFKLQQGSAGWRLKLWGETINMIERSPWIGIGAGNWKIDFQQSGLAVHDNVFNASLLNDYLSVLSETGMFGLIGFAGAIIIAVVKLGTLAYTSYTKPSYYLALSASLTTYAVIAFFSFPKDRIEHTMFLMFMLAVAAGSGQTFNPKFNKILGRATTFILFPFLCAALYSAMLRYNGERYMRQALDARQIHEWKNVVNSIDHINLSFYSMDPSTTPVLWYRGSAYFQMKEYDLAFEDFKKAYRVNPYHVHVLNNLGTLYSLRGNHNKAIELYNNALSINNRFHDAFMNLLIVYFNLNKYKEAILLIT